MVAFDVRWCMTPFFARSVAERDTIMNDGLGAFAIVLAAINTVFYSALRLRNSTPSAIEKALPMEHALGVIKRDLANLVLPGGTMSGTFTTSSTSNNVAGQSSP